MGQTGGGVVDTEETESYEAGTEGGGSRKCTEAEKTTPDKTTTVVRIFH